MSVENKPVPQPESNAGKSANKAAAKPQKIPGLRGMNDLLPEDSARWEQLEDSLRAWLKSYGYRLIRTPVLEETRLYTRGIGEVTDIVEKEMYSFEDALNGEKLTLRPEFTAGVVRSVIEHNLTYNAPQRLYSMGPVFRHERPQRGRYRQFHQLDVEAVGFAGPDIDAEMIIMLQRLWDELDLGPHVRLEINSLGSTEERLAHRQALIAYFEQHVDVLDEEAKRRLHSNPLRILDTKNPAMQAMVEAAPKLSDYLGEASMAHFMGVQALLKNANIHFRINPRLVRGLDYYNLTVFEWITDSLGAQGTICGGGRYDGLIEILGGLPTPAVGFAIGMERLSELLKELNWQTDPASCDVYIIHQGEAAQKVAFILAEQLRDVMLDVVLHCNPDGKQGSFKSQMKKADASGADCAVIIGDDEVANGEVTLKWLREQYQQEGQAQLRVAQTSVAEAIFDVLLADDDESE